MTTGQNCLKYHCLMRWVAKMERDGPDAPFDGTPAARRLTLERHKERIRAAKERAARVIAPTQGEVR